MTRDVDTHGQSPWHSDFQASLDALRANTHSPTGIARGTLPFGLLGDIGSLEITSKRSQDHHFTLWLDKSCLTIGGKLKGCLTLFLQSMLRSTP